MLDEKKLKINCSDDTRVVHGYEGADPYTGSVSFPIYQTSTYLNPGLDKVSEYSYSRCQNPTREELENTIAMLESGYAGFAFATGLAAVLATFSLLSSGDHIVMSDDIYGGTYRLLETIWKRYGVLFDYVDVSDLEAVRAAVKPNTKMIFVETPTNPMMKVADIGEIAKIAKPRGILTVVDNTFLTPYFQKPISLGADIVIHSATKYLAGHHDTMAGLLVVNSEELSQQVRHVIKTEGSGLSPFDSWCVLRGIKTLALRMKRHEENAIAAAAWLKKNPNVDKVYFVGLPEHPSYEITKKQSTGFGGMISFTVKDVKKIPQVLTGGDLIMFAESLGGTETLITYPMTQTHASIPKEVRDKIGITDKLVRLSVGIEDSADIIRDLEKMLS